MPESKIPFDLYDTPEPPQQLTDAIEAQVKRSQRAAILSTAERRQSRKLWIAAGTAGVLAVAVVVLLFVSLRNTGGQAAECPIYYAALGGRPAPAPEEAALAEFRPAAARKLASPGLLRQFDTVQARTRVAKEIARARRARLAAERKRGAGKATQQKPTLTSTAIRQELDRVRTDLTGCYSAVGDLLPDDDLIFALSVAGEHGQGALVENVAVSSMDGLQPDSHLVECATQTLLSLLFPPPAVGGRILVAYSLRAPGPEPRVEERVVAASRPKPKARKSAVPKGASRQALVEKARAAAKAGQFRDALELAEAALKRKPDDQDAIMVAVIAACNMGKAKTAGEYIPRLSSDGRRAMAGQICKKQIGYNPAAKAGKAKTCLDEVGCLLSDSPPACCKQYGKPLELADRASIKAGIAAVRDRVAACGKQYPGSGRVTVNVSVSPKGNTAEVTVRSASNAELGKCVADAVRKATFRATQKGGSFSYPFVFR